LGQELALPGRRLVLLSAIANPESFARTVRALGGNVLDHLRYPDHHAFGEADRATIARAADRLGADCILTTEKDAVRLEHLLPLGRPAFALRVALELQEGVEALASVLGVRLPERRDG
jgi:tetraacyldisaccharide 4'-kinase